MITKFGLDMSYKYDHVTSGLGILSHFQVKIRRVRKSKKSPKKPIFGTLSTLNPNFKGKTPCYLCIYTDKFS